MLANTVWVLLLAASVAAFALFIPLVALAPVLALPTTGLMRLAVVAARSGVPTSRHVGEELRRRPLRKILVAAAQLVLTLLALANLSASIAIGGVVGVVTGLVAFYALVLVSLYAIVLWPILADPERDGPLRWQLRLATVLVLTRLLPLIVLLVFTVLAIVVSVQLVVPSLILPSIVMLSIAAYVVPQADALKAAADR